MNQTMTSNHNIIQQSTKHDHLAIPTHERVYDNYDEGLFDEDEDYCYDGDVYDEYDFSLNSVKAIGGGGGCSGAGNGSSNNFRGSNNKVVVGDGRIKKNRNNEKGSGGGSSSRGSNKPTIYSQKHIRIQQSMRDNNRMKRNSRK